MQAAGYKSDGIGQRAWCTESDQLGANADVVKPINDEDLLRTVRRINDFWERVEAPGKLR